MGGGRQPSTVLGGNLVMRKKSAIVLVFAVVLSACGGRQAPPTAVVQPNAAPPANATAAMPAPAAQPAAPAEPPVSSPPAEVSYVPAGSPAASQPTVNTSPAPQPEPRFISIPAGTVFRVRLDETLDTRRNRAGDRFSATLVRRISEHGATVIPAGTRCYGHLTAAQPSGRFKGRAVLGLSLDSFDLHGRQYAIATNNEARVSGNHKKRNWVLMGGGSGTGAAIGAVAAGPFGALVGAGAGGAAGTVGAAFTGKKNVRLPVESVLAFSLRKPLPVAE